MNSHNDGSTHRVSHRKSKTENGYMNSPSLLGAAEAVSFGISSALKQISGITDLRPRAFKVGANKMPGGDKPVKKSEIYFQGTPGDLREEKKESTISDGDSLAINAGSKHRRPSSSLKSPPQSTSLSSVEDQTAVTKKESSLPSTRLKRRSSRSRKPRFTTKDEKTPGNSPSPMARMRDQSTQEALVVGEPHSASSTPVRKTHEQVKAEKQHKWKTKMKMAQAKQRQERRALDRGNQFSKENVIDSKNISYMLGTRVLDLIGQCGAIDDIVSDSESSADEDSGDDDNSRGSGSSDGSGRRGLAQQARSPSGQRDSHAFISPRNPDGDESPNREAKEMMGGNSGWPRDGTWPATATPERRKRNDNTPEVTPPRDHFSQNSDLLGSIVSPTDVRSPMTENTGEAVFLYDDNENLDFPPSSPPRRSRVGEPYSESPSNQWSSSSSKTTMSSASMDPQNKDFIKAFVHDMTYDVFSLLWHKEKQTTSPSTVQMKLKMGYRTPKGTFSGPRLAWKESEFETYGVNLFDITSLERANPVHLQDYPFAMPSRTVFLRMDRGQDFVFEARTENEAFRFVHGMRWVIARLSFNLVIGNIDVACELLDVGLKSNAGTMVHLSLIEEARRATAMDDLTDQLVERSVYHRQVI